MAALEARVVLEGWLVKRGHAVPSWRKRYFVLAGFQLSYFRDLPGGGRGKRERGPPRGTLDIRHYSADTTRLPGLPRLLRLLPLPGKGAAPYFLAGTEEGDEACVENWLRALHRVGRDFAELQEVAGVGEGGV